MLTALRNHRGPVVALMLTFAFLMSEGVRCGDRHMGMTANASVKPASVSADTPTIRKPVYTPTNGKVIHAPSTEEARLKLRDIQRRERAAGECCTTQAVIRKCSHFDVGTRDYPTCVDWVWDSISNSWRPGYHDAEVPSLACHILRLDADFKVGPGGGTLVQRVGSPNGNFTYIQVGFNTAFYKDSQDPRVQTKVTTRNDTGTTCGQVAHATIYN